MADEAVSDSGPIIHLAQINRFNLLSVFSRIFIPKAVYDEVCIAGKPGNKELRRAGFVEVCEISNDDAEAISKRIEVVLDEGETHALALCMKLDKNVFLTDDLDAREAGVSIGLEVHGSVGVIARAYKQGLIDLIEAKAVLNDLYNVSNLFVARAIIESVIEEIEKY
ncbi:MAG: DUF3368 domain-containing protein [Candidatus Methanoperedens sp.]|nr:DUF3368 domain-containing protein [Candidatus Methanoperedens sp.]